MRKKGGRFSIVYIIIKIMEKKLGLTELSEKELIECNGGFFAQLIITAFIPTFEKVKDFVEGLKEGYQRAISG